MSIHGSILYDNMFGHADTERSKVPQSLDTTGNDLLGYLLRLIDRHGDDTDRSSVLFLLGRKIIQMENRYSVDRRTCQLTAYIETGNNLQSVLIQPGVLQQCRSQATHTK